LTQKSKRKGAHIKAILYQFDKRTFEYINDEKADTDVYIFCNKHYLVIAFRGTAFTMVDGFSFKDVMQDLKVKKVPFYGGKVHRGFHQQYSGQFRNLKYFIK
jgi:hypothetical protein